MVGHTGGKEGGGHERSWVGRQILVQAIARVQMPRSSDYNGGEARVIDFETAGDLEAHKSGWAFSKGHGMFRICRWKEKVNDYSEQGGMIGRRSGRG